MINDLVKLANYLDERNLIRQANIVDIFISKVAAEPTWIEDNNLSATPQGSEYMADENSNTNSFKVQTGDGAVLDLEKNPLGRAMYHFVENVFLIADTGVDSSESEGIINKDDMTDLCRLALSYDETLKGHSDVSSNPDPLEPMEFRELLNSVARYVGSSYSTVKVLSQEHVDMLLFNLFRIYQDLYVEDYLGEQKEYPVQEQPVPSYNPNDPNELSPFARENLFNKNESETDQMRQLYDLEREEKQKNPEAFQSQLNRRRQRLKRDFFENEKEKDRMPREWEQILFDQ